jgi:hypothetical protein
MFAQILIGLVVCGLGFTLVKWPSKWLDFIGPIGFAEKALSGGSRSFYKLLGVIVILIGFLVMTNMHKAFFGGLAKFFFG